jgi:PAS domain S-box-containing protein
MLYEILTGQAPFTGSETAEVLRKVREEEPRPPRQLWPEVPPALEAICLRALAKRPEERPAAAGDLAREVQGWQEYERRKAEEALRESEALYHSLVESLPCSVFRKDLEGRFTFANQRFCELVGRPLDRLLGKNDFDINPRDLAEKYRRDDQKVLATGCVFEDIEEHTSRIEGKGNPYLHVLKTAVRDADGHIIGVQGISWDVTARKLAEEELRKSRERFELAVLASQDGLWDWDVETNQVWYSPQMRKMLGYDEEEFPNRPGETEKRVHPDDHARWRAVLHGHVEGTTDHMEMEYRILHKDGTYRWVRDRGVALRRPDGRAYRIAGSREDITQRKRSEEALAYERTLFNSLMDSVPEVIIFKSLEGRYTRVNASFAAMFGRCPEELLGKTVHDLFPAEYAQADEAAEREIIRTGQPDVDRDVHVTFPDGRTIWALRTKMPLRDSQGHMIGTVQVGRDITQRKRSEEALRQSEERYRSVIAAMQDGIVVLDADGGIRSCNAAAERILGLSAEQLMGRTPQDPRWRIIHEDGSPFPAEQRPLMVTLHSGRPCSDVIMGVHKPDGTLTWISVNSQPLCAADGQTLAGVVASFEDVSERKRIEDELRQTAAELALLRRQSVTIANPAE